MEGNKSDIIGNVVEEEDGCITKTEEEVDEEIEAEVFTTETKEIGVSQRKPRDRHDTYYLSISETPEISGPENDEREREREGNDEDNEPEKNEKEIEVEVFTTEAKEIGVSQGKPRDRHDTCYLSISETPEEIENEKN